MPNSIYESLAHVMSIKADNSLHSIIADELEEEQLRRAAKDELKHRVIRKLRVRASDLAGRCANGRKIMSDQFGAYSSGCFIHTDDFSLCGHSVENHTVEAMNRIEKFRKIVRSL